MKFRSFCYLLRGNPLSENRFFLKNSIFQKPHILVALSVLFQNMYKLYMNGAYLDQLWRVCLFIHNVITAIFAMLLFVFLSFTFFLFSDHYGTFLRSIAQCILLIFFYSKDQTFLYKLQGQIFKICICYWDIWKSLKELKTVFAILRLKRSLYFNENEFKKSVPPIFR